jgi:hypothetical protein
MTDFDLIDCESANWKTGTVVVINSKDRLEDPDNFFNYIYNYLSGTSETSQYTNEPIVIEFNNNLNNSDSQSKKIISLQDFKPEQYFNEHFQVDFTDYSSYNIYNYFPNSISIKHLSDDNNNNSVEYLKLICINLYDKYFLGINRIDTVNTISKKYYQCYFKLFNKDDSKMVFLIDKMNYGETTITYKFAYNSSVLDELSILTILKKIMIK